MNVWAISDLHLAFARPDRSDRPRGRSVVPVEAIEREWRSVVGRDDLVLLPGDISMARNHREVQPDLAWLGRLPGHKVIAPGNHDLWWNRVEKIRPMLRHATFAVGGDALAICGAVVCGTRGAPDPGDDPSPPAKAEADRELAALNRALALAADLRSPGDPLYVLWHYPPFDAHGRPGPWVASLEAAEVTACVYGHIHSQGQWSAAAQGIIRGVRYHCVAADSIGYRPLRLEAPSHPRS